METTTNKPIVKFYGGKLGAWMPIISLVAGIFLLTLAGQGGVKAFWIPAYVALNVGFLLCKDKKEFNTMAIDAITDSMFANLVLAFLLAGVLSQLLRQSGLINGLLWLAMEMNLGAHFMPLIIFLTSAVISTACGTCSGTVTTVTPVMYPLAVTLGCDPALILGAIISGSYFGDNLAPISDTTIASAYTNDAEVNDCVMSRLPYSILAGGLSCLLYVYFGFRMTGDPIHAVEIDPTYARTLVMLILPVSMVILAMKLRNLVATMLICNLAGIVLNLVFGFVPMEKMISTSGPIVVGLEGMCSVIFFCLLLFIIIELAKRSGVFEQIINLATKHCKTPAQAELVCAGMGAVAAAMAAQNTSCICLIGPVVRRILKKFHIINTRGANLIDATCVAVTGIIPYGISLMMMYTLAVESGMVPEGFSTVNLIPYSFHCILLIAVYLVSIVTGIGRKYEPGFEQVKK